jgi:glucokinase
MILAGDVGATKTLFELGELQHGRWMTVFGARYVAADYPDFFSVLQAFFSEWTAQQRSSPKISRACLGVAGPVFDNRVQMTNLPWLVDGDAIAARFGIAHVKVVNDFAAAAKGIELLQPADLVTLQSGEPVAAAPRLVIGPGTGLGVAYMVWAGDRYLIVAGESGSTGFAPATPEQLDLWRDLYLRQGRVVVEDVVSGSGLVRIFEFLCRRENKPPAIAGALSAGESAAEISHAALERGDPLCLRALDMFVSCFGAIAGDHALSIMARGGVYIAGGIAPKILQHLKNGGFCAAFNAKGVHSAALRKIPVFVVTNEKLGLLGAALLANA